MKSDTGSRSDHSLLPSTTQYTKTLLVLLFFFVVLLGKIPAASLGGDITPDGQPCHVVLPFDQRMKNLGGSDGAGLCVFTSNEHSGRAQNIPELIGFQKWMTRRPGGGYPQKVDQMLAAFCKEKGVAVPAYIQVEGLDLEVIRKACQSGRMPGTTYSWSATGRYGGQWIAHMVNTVHADDKWFGILDNNYIDQIEWLNEVEYKKTYYGRSFGGQPARGWSVIFLAPGMPPQLRTP